MENKRKCKECGRNIEVNNQFGDLCAVCYAKTLQSNTPCSKCGIDGVKLHKWGKRYYCRKCLMEGRIGEIYHNLVEHAPIRYFNRREMSMWCGVTIQYASVLLNLFDELNLIEREVNPNNKTEKFAWIVEWGERPKFESICKEVREKQDSPVIESKACDEVEELRFENENLKKELERYKQKEIIKIIQKEGREDLQEYFAGLIAI